MKMKRRQTSNLLNQTCITFSSSIQIVSQSCFYLPTLGSRYILPRENCSCWRQLRGHVTPIYPQACAIKLLEFIFFNSPTLISILPRQITPFLPLLVIILCYFSGTRPWMPPRRRIANFKQNVLLDCSYNTERKGVIISHHNILPPHSTTCRTLMSSRVNGCHPEF